MLSLQAEDEEEDKDKCRICKNAVLFLKYKRVETKMIKCSECGKIGMSSTWTVEFVNGRVFRVWQDRYVIYLGG